jgi:hypothetical protein
MPMIITVSQMTAFKSQARRNFAKRLAAHFEAGYAGQLSHSGERIPSGTALEQQVLELIAVADGFGISTERGAGQFVVLGLGYSRTFYELPGVVAILAEPAFTAEQNIQRAMNAVILAEARVA